MKRMRLLSGIRQTDFATKCLITPGYLANLEAGRKQPAEDMLKRLADELGVDLYEITYVIAADTTGDLSE